MKRACDAGVGTMRGLDVVVRSAPGGQLVRDRVLGEWRIAWVVRGVRGEYLRGGRAVRVGPRWVEVRFAVEREPGQRWRREVELGRKAEEGDLMIALIKWVWGQREVLEKEAEVVGSVLGALWGVFVSGRAGSGEPTSVVLPGAVVRALVFIRGEAEDRPGRLLTNKEIAEAGGCSQPWLQFLFKRHLGVYPVQWARAARVDRAVEILGETDWPVAVVAAMCGFVSPSHLSKLMAKRIGLHASGFRRAMRAGTVPAIVRRAVVAGQLA